MCVCVRARECVRAPGCIGACAWRVRVSSCLCACVFAWDMHQPALQLGNAGVAAQAQIKLYL